MKPVFLAIAFCFLAAGCFQRPTQDEITRSAAAIQEEAALDLIEKRITESSGKPADDPKAAQPSAATRQGQKTTPAPAAETKKTDAIGDAVLKYADWLYFVLYCVLALIMAWYVKKTGQQNETLQKISDTVSGRLTIKHRMLFRILRFIYRKKKKKQEEKK